MEDEQRRIAELQDLNILDTAAEASFDDLLSLAAALCETSLGAITFVGVTHVFHKATLGLPVSNVFCEASFCEHTIRQNDLFIVEDAFADSRFQSNELIRQAGIRFYAGVPLASSSGTRVGALCVIGHQPRQLSPSQGEHLRRVARQISVLLELRLERTASVTLTKQLEAHQKLFDTYFEHSPVETHLKDEEGRIALYNMAFANRFNIDKDEWVGKSPYDLWPREVADEVMADERKVRESGISRTKYMVVVGNGGTSHWRATRIPCKNVSGQPMTLCISVDVTREVQKKQELERIQGDLEVANSRLRELLKLDDLTGLHNRRAFEEHCVAALNRLKTNGGSFSIVHIDMGALAIYNRRLGGLAVDGMLRDIGRAILIESLSFEMAARISGGAYRILAFDNTSSDNERLMGKIKSNIAAVQWRGGVLSPTISVRRFEDRNLHPSKLFLPHVKSKHGDNQHSKENSEKKQTQRVNTAYSHLYEPPAFTGARRDL